MSKYPTQTQPGEMQPYGALPAPYLTPDLLALITTGTVYSLAVVYFNGMPVPGGLAPYMLTPHLRHGDVEGILPASAATEVMQMSAHTGTHIDALCHIGEHQDADGNPDPTGQGRARIYDGDQPIPADEQVNEHGQQHMSIAQMPPILTRGVLVDVAGNKGVDVLPDAYEITAEDIESAITAQGTEIQPGTAVLVRTGFYQHLRDGNPAYRDAIAGLRLDAAKFLRARGMILAGADNMTVEAMPPTAHSVHRYLLTHNGVSHLENLYLEELASKQVYEFLLIVTPLRLQGATGSWVHPIALA